MIIETNTTMEKDTHITGVIFRKYKDGGEILALFPYEAQHNFMVLCYQHIGQHGSADYSHCVDTLTVPATENESKSLKNELEDLYGYNLKVLKRRNYNKFLEAYKELRGLY